MKNFIIGITYAAIFPLVIAGECVWCLYDEFITGYHLFKSFFREVTDES